VLIGDHRPQFGANLVVQTWCWELTQGLGGRRCMKLVAQRRLMPLLLETALGGKKFRDFGPSRGRREDSSLLLSFLLSSPARRRKESGARPL